MQRLLTAAGVLVLTAGLAQAQDVRQPDDDLSGIQGGDINLPEGAAVAQRQMRTTMDETEGSGAGAVDAQTVQDIRKLAIEEFGQSSSSEPSAENGGQETPPGVEDSYKAYRERMRQRGVDLPD